VPDGAGAVRFGDCCNLHDLGYYIGGSLWLKLSHDAALSACMGARWWASIREPVPWWRRTARALGWFVTPPVYFLAVTLFGWVAWDYRGKPPPSHAELEAIAGLSAEEIAALKRAAS
jgi:hypothetical protein